MPTAVLKLVVIRSPTGRSRLPYRVDDARIGGASTARAEPRLSLDIWIFAAPRSMPF